MTKVSVIIASWNKKKTTLETLESLVSSDLNNFNLEIVVIDNASEDGSPVAIQNFFKKNAIKNVSTKLIINPVNLGFAKGNNIGMEYALKNKSDFILLLNDDTIADKNMIRELLRSAMNNKNAGAFAPKIYFASGYEFHKNRYSKKDLGKVIWCAGGDIDWNNMYGTNHGVDEVDDGQFEKLRNADFLSGCCVLFPATVLKKVGLFDERYFAYLEDVDLSLRIKKAGYKLLYVPSAKVWHKVSQSSGIGSDLNDYFISRNRLLLGFKYAKLRTKFALFRESVRFLISGRVWQKTGVKDFYIRKFGQGSWGKK